MVYLIHLPANTTQRNMLRLLVFLALLAAALCYTRQLTCGDIKWKSAGAKWDMGTTEVDSKVVSSCIQNKESKTNVPPPFSAVS
jgi:hypothetical protein